MRAETDTASFPRKGSYPRFPAFKLQATVFFLVFSARVSAVWRDRGDHLLFATRCQPAACPNARICGRLGAPEVDTGVRCGAGQTGFHLLLCFMWPAAVRRGIQTRTTNGSDAQPGDIKPTRVVPVLGSYLFKVLLFGSSCLPTSVFHGCVSNHWC